jgi:hypothetical protein
MDIQKLFAIGSLGAIAAAHATEPAAVPVMEEVVVTAKHPVPEVVDEIVVTARAPVDPVAAGDAAQRAVELEAQFRSRLREYAHAVPPQLRF